MTDKELLVILKNEDKKKIQMRKELVRVRVKETDKEKFDIKEVYYFSEYFGISMNNFLIDILCIHREEYNKFLKGHIIQVNSEIYNQMKKDYIFKKKKIFNSKVNWNRRTYYNRKRLFKIANNLEINVIDFSMIILEKSRPSVRRVLNDESSRNRLFIGRYVNGELPKGYLEANIDKIILISKSAIRGAAERLGINMQRIDYEDELQKCLIYIQYNGNSFNKNNILEINSIELNEKLEKRFFLKLYYYEINQIKELSPETQYIENMVYKDSEKNFYDLEDEKQIIKSLGLNIRERRIVSGLLNGYTEKELVIKEKISLDEIIKVKNKIKEQIQV